ncbi:uncharacterized protein LOC111892585 [Lactuca sativa]|uniref:uncharacterized protein LOC111892585 n=1 Tax=Lactuca sativa TaxID=4236 RepID=UPI000CD92AD5|nr:uncharacterized protein LOC111892585 [Lactuca sativa]
MEGLNVMMKAAREKGIFDGIPIPNTNISLSHLFYADDTLFIGDWSTKNVSNLARILRCFHAVSGLKVNSNKSRVFGVRVEFEEVCSRVGPLGCALSSLPFTYLGVLVGENMNKKKAWKPIIDKTRSKLSVWKAKTLSLSGMVTLVKHLLGNLPTFYFSLFPAPNGIIEELEKKKSKDSIYEGVARKRQLCIRLHRIN